jgi:hypothetical protein
MLAKEFINYQEKLFWVYKKITTHKIKEERIQDLREFWMCDIVLKQRTQQDEIFLFLREIPEAELAPKII